MVERFHLATVKKIKCSARSCIQAAAPRCLIQDINFGGSDPGFYLREKNKASFWRASHRAEIRKGLEGNRSRQNNVKKTFGTFEKVYLELSGGLLRGSISHRSPIFLPWDIILSWRMLKSRCATHVRYFPYFWTIPPWEKGSKVEHNWYRDHNQKFT